MWGSIGNFFSSLFGGNRKREDEKRPPQPPAPINIDIKSPTSIMPTVNVPQRQQPVDVRPQETPKPQQIRPYENPIEKQNQTLARLNNTVRPPSVDPNNANSRGREFSANVNAMVNSGLKGVGEVFSGIARVPQFVVGIDNYLKRAGRDEFQNRMADEVHHRLGGVSDWMDQRLRDTYDKEVERNFATILREQERRNPDRPGQISPLTIAGTTGANVLGNVADILVPGGAARRGASTIDSIVAALRRGINPRDMVPQNPIRFGGGDGIRTEDLMPPAGDPVRVPIQQRISVADESLPQNIQVTTPDRPLIQDVSGGANTISGGMVPQPPRVNLPRTSSRMDDVGPGSQTSPDTITRQELDAEINSVRSDPNLSTSQKNDIIRQLQESGGTKIPVRQQVAVESPETPPAPKPPKKTGANEDGELTITQQEVAAQKEAVSKQAEEVGLSPSQLDNLAPQDQQATIAAIRNNQSAPPTSGGFAPTGRTATGKRGNEYEPFSRETEQSQAAIENAGRSKQSIVDDYYTNPNSDLAGQTRRVQDAINDPNLSVKDPMFKELVKVQKEIGTKSGQLLKAQDFTRVRRAGSADQVTKASIGKLEQLAGDTSKILDSDIDRIAAANDNFVAARDMRASIMERIKSGDGDQATLKKELLEAQKAYEQADVTAKTTELDVFRRVLKNNTDKDAMRALQRKKQESDVYTMDWVDTNLLSSTGTMTRNIINPLLPALENRIFGQLAGTTNRRSFMSGLRQGGREWNLARQARKDMGENWFRRQVTAGNTAGEGLIEGLAQDMAGAEWRRILKSQGYKGDQLDNLVSVNVLNDTDNITTQFRNAARMENALGGTGGKRTKFEQDLANRFTDWADNLVGNNTGISNSKSQFIGKAIARLAVGYPSVIGRSLVGGAKRASFGVADLLNAGMKLRAGDKTAARRALQDAVKHGSSGVVLTTLGSILAAAGLISGSYPDDPQERKDWESEGKTEHSIKIGDSWYSIPGYTGGFALPLLIGAGMNSSRDGEDFLGYLGSVVTDSSPIDSLYDTLKGINGDSGKNWWNRTAAQALRTVTPVSGLLNEISKMVDPTKNDYTRSEGIQNIIERYAGGLPFVNNLVNTTDKVDQFGNTIKNPNPVELLLGAASSGAGSASALDSRSMLQNSQFSDIASLGVFDNEKLTSLVDKNLLSYISQGQNLTDKEMQDVYKSITKGATVSGDSVYRENGDYATDLQVLNVKKLLMQKDPLTRPSDLKNIDTQIKRSEILSENDIPYDALRLYQSTSQSDWRAMGDPTSNSYDPDTYQRLAAIDQLFASSGASYRSGDPTKNKYVPKQGGSGGRNQFSGLGSSVVNWSNYLPKLQEYDKTSLMPGSVSIPKVRAENPRIIHKITRG